MAKTPSISVVLVNWNSQDDLRSCLLSLAQQTDRDFEIVVVDNGSTDGSLEMLGTDFPGVTTVATGENLGFAEACNRGIDRAVGVWIALLNNDAVAAPDWLANLRRAAAKGEPRLGMVQSRILFKHDPSKLNSTGVIIRSDGFFIDRAWNEPVPDRQEADEIFCVSAGAALYRRTMLDEIRLDSGIFDRDYFMYFEDVDLGWRARLAGWSAVYEPSATVHHAFHGTSSRRGKDFVGLQCAKNRLRTILKNGSRTYIVRSSLRIVGDLVWAMSREGVRAIGAYAAAGKSGFRQRAAVARMARVSRRSVELAWITTAKSGRPSHAKRDGIISVESG
jgi:GT2 family glycosyltransferase